VKKVVLLLMVLLLILTACAQPTQQPTGQPTQLPTQQPTVQPTQQPTVQPIVDDRGISVKLTAKPQRIVSLLPSLTETLFSLGLGEQIIGVTNFCNYPAEVDGKERVGGLFDLNVEKILALEPDLIFSGQMEGAQEVLKALENAGVVVAVFDPATMDDIGRTIKLIAKLTGVEVIGETLAKEIAAGREAITAQVKEIDEDKPRVFVLLDTEQIWTVGDGEYLSEMITEAGGVNAASGQVEGWLQLSEEKLFELDPDIIIATFPMREQLLDRPGWQILQAIRNGRVYDVNGDLVSRPGPRVVLGLQELHRAFYE